MKRYSGSCHCGRTRFEVETALDQVYDCDCSICRRRGGLMQWEPPERMVFLTPIEDLSVYQWNTGTAIDYFCPVCGILPYRRPRSDPSKWCINVRCLDGVDWAGLTITRAKGSALSLKASSDPSVS